MLRKVIETKLLLKKNKVVEGKQTLNKAKNTVKCNHTGTIKWYPVVRKLCNVSNVNPSTSVRMINDYKPSCLNSSKTSSVHLQL